MPRDTNGIIGTVWAGTGDTEDPSNVGLSETVGWPVEYEQTESPQREVFNWFWRMLTAFGKDQGAQGILEWHAMQPFAHPSVTLGSDGRIYKSVQASTGVNPVTDTDFSHWKPLIATTDGTVAASGALTADAIPGLPASKIVSGLLNIARIPTNLITIGASQVTSGVFNVARIPSGLSANLITTGIFNVARIPDMGAGKITSGVFAIARIPVSSISLAASQITSGVLAAARLPTATASAKGAVKVRTLTEAQYDALTTKDAETQYYFTS